jgi:PBP1b-binding outer membrane lipoprotein LpoB
MTKKIFLTTLALSGLFISGIAGLVVTTNAQNSNISSNNISFEQRQVDRQAIKEALEKGDYEAWKIAVAKTPRGEEMLKAVDTEDDFKKLMEAHNARKNGDIETFKTITKDLRINMGEKMMKGGRAGKMMKGSL